jgi:hypothetical protein
MPATPAVASDSMAGRTTALTPASSSRTAAQQKKEKSATKVLAGEYIYFFWYDPSQSLNALIRLPPHLQLGLASCVRNSGLRPVLLRYQQLSHLPKGVVQRDCGHFLQWSTFEALLAKSVTLQHPNQSLILTLLILINNTIDYKTHHKTTISRL